MLFPSFPGMQSKLSGLGYHDEFREKHVVTEAEEDSLWSLRQFGLHVTPEIFTTGQDQVKFFVAAKEGSLHVFPEDNK